MFESTLSEPVFVLVHGAWHGGWCWARVAAFLRVSGYRVFTPTLTGLGERQHLISREITLDTMTQDVVNLIDAEELSNVVLVGNSFGGSPVSGAADRIPEKIRHLVYLDARILEPGQTLEQADPGRTESRRQLAQETSGGVSVPPPTPLSLGIPHGSDADWVARRMTPHPFGTFTTPLNLCNQPGNGLPCTYVACIDPYYEALDSSRRWAKNRKGWEWREIATGHDAMVTAPEQVAKLLLETIN